MPTSTFYKLSDEKKDRIFDAAMKEFSVRTFDQASLNQIIKNAGIPKGSFYQYFDNKEDLYLYMTEVISKEMAEQLSTIDRIHPEADVFEVIMHETKEFLECGKLKPGYIEAAMMRAMDDSEFIKKMHKSSPNRYVKLLDRDKQRGVIKPEVDSELVINMISTFSLNEYFRNRSDTERYFKNLCKAIKIIKDGIAVPMD